MSGGHGAMRTYTHADLQRLEDEARAIAARHGIEPGEVVFHYASAERIYDIAARGLPGRYAHWRFGRDYEQQKGAYDEGRARIYELVLNTRPAQAYLLEGNSIVAQLLVIAHVIGHAWVFERNRCFAQSDRRFLERVKSAAERFEGYATLHGRAAVEEVIDAANVLMFHQPLDATARRAPDEPPARPPVDPYADLFEDESVEARARFASDRAGWRRRFPHEPDEDVIGFIGEHAAYLADWERDVIAYVREEGRYFAPMLRTKVLNEGVAVWVHNLVLQEMRLDTSEFVAFQRLNAGVAAPYPDEARLADGRAVRLPQLRVNPYNLGWELLREVERIHGTPTTTDLERWPFAENVPASERIAEIVEAYDDVALIAEYLTPEVCERCNLYAWEHDDVGRIVVSSREADVVRERLVEQHRALGIPRLVVEDADLGRRGGLLLRHLHEGVGLDAEYAAGTLPQVARLWGRRVVVESVRPGPDDEPVPVWHACPPGGPSEVLGTRPDG